jgi:hypothetical protein
VGTRLQKQRTGAAGKKLRWKYLNDLGDQQVQKLMIHSCTMVLQSAEMGQSGLA